MVIKIKKININAVIPQYKTEGSAGFDFTIIENKIVQPLHTELFATGLSFELKKGTEMHIRPRSSTFKNSNLLIEGTIDSDYRGEVKIMVKNVGSYPIELKNGDRIAQGIISQVERVTFSEVIELEETLRGEGGFGSTGDVPFVSLGNNENNQELKKIIDEVIKNDQRK